MYYKNINLDGWSKCSVLMDVVEMMDVSMGLRLGRE